MATGWRDGAIGQQKSNDAVIIVPGIMGSVLVDADSGEEIWNPSPGRLFGWLTPQARDTIERLRVTDEELGGRVQRVKPAGLIQAPVWAPFLRGLMPYTGLIANLRRHPALDATTPVVGFAYDWRLDIDSAARRLGRTVADCLQKWSGSAAELRLREQTGHGEPGGVGIVAHSTGGLVVRSLLRMAAAGELGPDSKTVAEGIRRIVTLGTPFHGSSKAVAMLARTSHAGRLRALFRTANGVGRVLDQLGHVAVTMPGIYDLLPDYPCIVDRHGAVRPLADRYLKSRGADAVLLAAARRRRTANAATAMGCHSRVVGGGQPTPMLIDASSGAHVLTTYAVAFDAAGAGVG
ncbi:MAG: hypothetical protein LBE08_10160, partial [Bifidobacteriaceae bacterium]|nr:hypothetical protein [Bifidobacteriaceae bacterium]